MTKILLTIFLFLNCFVFGQKTVDTKSFGQKILNGQVKYKDGNENEFMRTLDSLFCKNPDNKLFYFKTANKIQQMSDGVLSEYFSSIASKYYLTRNSEFISNVSALSQKEQDAWLVQVAFDIAANEQDTKKLPLIKKRLTDLADSCRCAAPKKDLIKKYNATLYEKIKIEIKNH